MPPHSLAIFQRVAPHLSCSASHHSSCSLREQHSQRRWWEKTPSPSWSPVSSSVSYEPLRYLSKMPLHHWDSSNTVFSGSDDSHSTDFEFFPSGLLSLTGHPGPLNFGLQVPNQLVFPPSLASHPSPPRLASYPDPPSYWPGSIACLCSLA